MTGTITELHSGRGVGSIIGHDGKIYLFHRGALQDAWFHDLRMGDAVTFEPADGLRAKLVRLVREGRD